MKTNGEIKTNEKNLADLLLRGGIVRNIPGDSPREVLLNLIKAAPLPPSLQPETLLEAVLEREALMPTAMGKGIALPHPRHPLISDPEQQMVVMGFLKQSLDWKALDGRPVHTLLLIVSASAKLHLRTLSEISFFCHQENFQRLLENRAGTEDIISAIRKTEDEWDTAGKSD